MEYCRCKSEDGAMRSFLISLIASFSFAIAAFTTLGIWVYINFEKGMIESNYIPLYLYLAQIFLFARVGWFALNGGVAGLSHAQYTLRAILSFAYGPLLALASVYCFILQPSTEAFNFLDEMMILLISGGCVLFLIVFKPKTPTPKEPDYS